MSKKDLILEDWKMTKDRIKHFDDVVIRLRLQGIPIGTAIQAAGLASVQYTQNLKIWGISVASLIIALGSVYLLPIFFLDLLHYNLLLASVRHGKHIEGLPAYEGKLSIMMKLTSHKLTLLHTICAILVYSGVITLGFVLAYFISTVPVS